DINKQKDNNEIETDTVDSGYPYVHINITNSLSRDVIKEFIHIFIILLRHYHTNNATVLSTYTNIIPQDEYNEEEAKAEEYNIPTEKTRLKHLKEQAPNLFISGYARKSPPTIQPVIVEKPAAWRKLRIPSKPNEDRQVLTPAFPYEGQELYFGCPNDDTPYPGVKTNNLKNRDIYPFLPSCFKINKMNGSSYKKYVQWVDSITKQQPNPVINQSSSIIEESAKLKNIIKTRKISSPGRIGIIPAVIENILKTFSPDEIDDPNLRIARLCVIKSPNSLLHCICTATDDALYLKSDNKEEYIRNLRISIANDIRYNPALLKQELYDYDDDIIINHLNNTDVFLDPALYYRIFEEHFGINIYVFYLPLIGENKDSGIIDIPRHRIFHSHPKRSYTDNLENPTIIILKTMGAEKDKLIYPQCELIIHYNTSTEEIRTKVFGSSMTNICHKILKTNLTTLTWTLTEDLDLAVYKNIYSNVDYRDIFKDYQFKSQFIDKNGKIRAITIEINPNHLVTIGTIPTQPLNLPIDTHIHRINIELAFEIFGNPTNYTYNVDGYVDGIWISMLGLDTGLYIPVEPIITTEKLVSNFPNPLIPPYELNITDRLRSLRRILNIIVQLVRWLFDIAILADPNTTPLTF
ncbi:MAG: hypothetical protein MUO21_00270, partial [Nitrososphaeraceae archaeon]|nr:hypothetical protein [Nitrososphaeraceae archaeon]